MSRRRHCLLNFMTYRTFHDLQLHSMLEPRALRRDFARPLRLMDGSTKETLSD
jgi:hypothetical protein